MPHVLTPGLTFVPTKHRYLLDGRVVPGVTSILKAAGYVDDTYFTEYARDRGSAAHAATHYYDEGDLDELDAFDDVPFLAENALSGDGAARDALLLFALQSAPVRDLVMLQWAFGLELGDALWSADTCAGIEARKVYSDIDSLAAELMLGRGPAPDTSRIDAARRVLTGLIGLAADDDRPAPLCMLAWLTWALGRGSEAGAYIDEVLAIAPEYSMGQLLHTMFSTGTMPDWVFTSPQTAT